MTEKLAPSLTALAALLVSSPPAKTKFLDKLGGARALAMILAAAATKLIELEELED